MYLFFLTFAKSEITRKASHMQTFHKKTARLITRTLLFYENSGERCATCLQPQERSVRRIDSEDSSRQQRRSRRFARFHECVGSSALCRPSSGRSRWQGQRCVDH